MPLLHVVGVLLLTGLLVWAVRKLPFVDQDLKTIIKVVVLITTAVWLVSLFVPINHLSALHVGR